LNVKTYSVSDMLDLDLPKVFIWKFQQFILLSRQRMQIILLSRQRMQITKQSDQFGSEDLIYLQVSLHGTSNSTSTSYLDFSV